MKALPVFVSMTFLALVVTNAAASQQRADTEQCFSSAADFGERVEACTRLIEAGGTSDRKLSELLIRRATALTGARRFHDAVRDVDDAIERNSAYAPAWEIQTLALGELGETEKALASANRFLTLSPGVPGPYMIRGRVHFDTGRLDLALQDLNKSIALGADEA